MPGAWHLMSVTLSAGGSLSWWRDQAGADFDSLVAEAEAVEPGSEGLVFLPYLTGERTPHLDPHARGAFVGLTVRHGRGTSRGRSWRAWRSRCATASRSCAGSARPTMTCARSAAARSPLWLALQADVYGRPVRRTVIDEGPAYGAALLGGVAAGAFADVGEAGERVRLRDEVTEPDPERAKRYDELYGVYTSLYPALRDAMHTLAA